MARPRDRWIQDLQAGWYDRLKVLARSAYKKKNGSLDGYKLETVIGVNKRTIGPGTSQFSSNTLEKMATNLGYTDPVDLELDIRGLEKGLSYRPIPGQNFPDNTVPDLISGTIDAADTVDAGLGDYVVSLKPEVVWITRQEDGTTIGALGLTEIWSEITTDFEGTEIEYGNGVFNTTTFHDGATCEEMGDQYRRAFRTKAQGNSLDGRYPIGGGLVPTFRVKFHGGSDEEFIWLRVEAAKRLHFEPAETDADHTRTEAELKARDVAISAWIEENLEFGKMPNQPQRSEIGAHASNQEKFPLINLRYGRQTSKQSTPNEETSE